MEIQAKTVTDRTGFALAALPSYLDLAVRNGSMAKSTAVSLRTAANRILEVVPEASDVELVHADIERIIETFRDRALATYPERTVGQYSQRFRQASRHCLRWLEQSNQSNDLPVQDRDDRPRGEESRVPTGSKAASHPFGYRQHSPSLNMIDYTLVLRPDVVIELELPHDLTEAEASRFARWVETLVVPERPNQQFRS
ncbi:hypothetical protein GCM10029992_37270 [Glycomyces albus]